MMAYPDLDHRTLAEIDADARCLCRREPMAMPTRLHHGEPFSGGTIMRRVPAMGCPVHDSAGPGYDERDHFVAPFEQESRAEAGSPPCFAEPRDLAFSELRETGVARSMRWHPGGINEWSLSDWCTATTGELGELANVAKKLNRVRDGLPGNSETPAALRAQLADEIADVAIYLDLLAASEGIDLAQAIIAKFNATSEKVGFPERLIGVAK